MIRYVWNQNDCKYLYNSPTLRESEKQIVPLDRQNQIFVNILDRQYDLVIKVKLFFADGRTMQGWAGTTMFPIELTNQDELFDGRFNQ